MSKGKGMIDQVGGRRNENVGNMEWNPLGDLISELRRQHDELVNRLALVDGMIEKLEHVNEKDGERDVDEVRQYVRDFLRVFTNEKQRFDPTGFSGDIGDGPTTAYDALPPKPWKA